MQLWIRRSVVRVHPAVPVKSMGYATNGPSVRNLSEILSQIQNSLFVLLLPLRDTRLGDAPRRLDGGNDVVCDLVFRMPFAGALPAIGGLQPYRSETGVATGDRL